MRCWYFLITNYQKKQTVTKLKKSYSVLSQAIRLSESDNGEIEGWEASSEDMFFEKYLAPYMTVTSEFRYSEIKNRLKYKRLNGSIETRWTPLYDGAKVYIDNSGSMFFVATSNLSPRGYLTIAIDINGFSNPNVIGKDFFAFNIIFDNKNNMFAPKITPYGANNTSDMPFGTWKRENTKTGSYACSKSGRGQFCAALIMIDEWEIKKDYPW